MTAKKISYVRIRVRTSFNGMYAGDEADVVLDSRVAGWVEAGVVEVLDGQDQAGPGGSE